MENPRVFQEDAPASALTYRYASDITLRDLFAGLAMNGLAECFTDNTRHLDDATLDRAAQYSYRMADALLEARGGQP